MAGKPQRQQGTAAETRQEANDLRCVLLKEFEHFSPLGSRSADDMVRSSATIHQRHLLFLPGERIMNFAAGTPRDPRLLGTRYDWPPQVTSLAPRHASPFLNSIARPEFNIERGIAPRPAVPAVQLRLKRDEARVAGPPLQQGRIWDDGLVRAGVTARTHQVERAQVLEAEGVARRHGRACSFLPFSV